MTPGLTKYTQMFACIILGIFVFIGDINAKHASQSDHIWNAIFIFLDVVGVIFIYFSREDKR